MFLNRNLFLSSLFLVAGSFAAGVEPAHQNPKSLADTPLDQCTPQAALGWAYGDSIGREGDSATQALRISEKMEALVNELPPGKGNVPIGQQMTPEQSGRFAELSAQMLIYRYNHLAESRLQRDVHMMSLAVDAIEKLQSGAPKLTSKDDPGGDGAGLVGLLRKSAEGDSQDRIDPNSGSICGLDLAMYLKEQAVYTIAQKHMASKETAEFEELRKKYKITGTVDPEKLPSPDREKAIWLQKAVADPALRYFQALQDWQNLRRFAKVSTLKYSTARDAIITGAGSKDYDYDANIRKAYEQSDAVTKQAMNAWYVIDENMPSEASKENAEMAKISKGAQAGKD
jgi:hypothetical protein